jgi:predicted amidohydrolase YtcJ
MLRILRTAIATVALTAAAATGAQELKELNFGIIATEKAGALRQMWDAGVDVRFGSDAPVTALDPWLAISAAVGRAAEHDAPWHAAEQLTVEEALRASVRSTVAVGQPADFAVLDADPLDATPAELATMPVSATFVGGRTTHSLL